MALFLEVTSDKQEMVPIVIVIPMSSTMTALGSHCNDGVMLFLCDALGVVMPAMDWVREVYRNKKRVEGPKPFHPLSLGREIT